MFPLALLGSSMVEHSAVNSSADEFQVRGAGRETEHSHPPVCFWVYVLINSQSKIYIGQTRNLAARVAQHNDPEYRGTLHTKRHLGPWRLVYQEPLGTRQAAMRRERELKSNRGREWIRALPQVRQSAG